MLLQWTGPLADMLYISKQELGSMTAAVRDLQARQRQVLFTLPPLQHALALVDATAAPGVVPPLPAAAAAAPGAGSTLPELRLLSFALQEEQTAAAAPGKMPDMPFIVHCDACMLSNEDTSLITQQITAADLYVCCSQVQSALWLW